MIGRAAARLRTTTPSERWLTATLVLAAALRFSTLAVQSLWEDEGFTARIASSPLASAVAQVPHTESTPPLYYALVWLWAHMFGDSAYALRSLSALFGCVTVWAVYWVGMALASRRVALVAAALTAVSPIMVWYSQEARAYALMVLLCVLAFGCFVRVLQRAPGRWLLAWAVLSAAALATHYFALFPLAAEAFWLLARAPARPAVLRVLALPGLVGAALLPLFLYQDAHVPRPWTAVFSVADQGEAIAQSFFVGITWNGIIHRGGVALLAVLALAAVVALVRSGDADERRSGLLLGAFAAVTLLIPLVISLGGTNYLNPRNVLYAWPLLALLVALGAGRRRAGRLSGAGAALAGLVSLAIVIAVASTPSLQRENWRGLLASLGPPRTARVVVVLDGFTDGPVVEYYVHGLRPMRHAVTVQEVDVISPLAQATGPAPAALHAIPFSGSARSTNGSVVVNVSVVGDFAVTHVYASPAAFIALPAPDTAAAFFLERPR
jgi:4-amino-4-deoxy-L-arabinose transferase-like glycosyltransferase